MNICFISFTYYPNVDGVQYVTSYQAENLVKFGHRVTVITSHLYGTQYVEIHNEVKIIRLPVWKFGLWTKGNKQDFQRKILSICREQDVVIDVCYYDFFSRWFIPLLPKISCKKMCMLHGTWEYHYTKFDTQNLKAFLRKTVQNIRWKFWFKNNEKYYFQFDTILHLHEKDESINYSERIGFSNNYVLMNAVDEVFFQGKSHYKKSNLPLVFIQVANYSFRKNQLSALRAFYAANLPSAELWMIGSKANDYYNLLVKENRKLAGDKNPKVKIFTELTRKETIEKIIHADITLLSSLSEHLPVTILEGLAAGLPYISTDVGVVNEIPGGIVCKTETELSNAMKELYDNDSLRKKLMEDGFRFANENCHIITQVKKMEKIINEL